MCTTTHVGRRKEEVARAFRPFVFIARQTDVHTRMETRSTHHARRVLHRHRRVDRHTTITASKRHAHDAALGGGGHARADAPPREEAAEGGERLFMFFWGGGWLGSESVGRVVGEIICIHRPVPGD